MSDIEQFYGPDTSLDKFNDAMCLEYIRENDPFECDPVRVERGDVFCKFTFWLMCNHLIPAWANEMLYEEKSNQALNQKRYIH
jgi:hypothetical protein